MRMTTNTSRMRTAAVTAAVLAAVAATAGCSSSDARRAREVDLARVADGVVASWSNSSALAARRLMEEYGAPDEARSGRLMWRGNGPWSQTVVWDQTPLYAPEDRDDLLEQTVVYLCAEEDIAKLAAFNPKIVVDRHMNTIAVRSSSQEVSYLTMNLADDIVNGRTTPERAREEYDRILRLSAAGKSSPYTAGLLFRFGTKP
jgi:hypothetical protein